MSARLAVLVDGDNISGKHAARILDIASRHGVPSVVRVYADARRATGWHGAIGYRLIHSGTGKNASDLLLAIDAMELALTSGMEAFVIASSDADFTHLVQRLRERGAPVTGIGEGKTPRSYRGSCSSFVVIGSTPAVELLSNPAPAVTDLDQKIRTVIATNSKNGAGMRIAALSPAMHAKHGTRISSYPERNWRAYLAARPSLYDLDPRGLDAMVRFKPEGFHACTDVPQLKRM